MRHLSVIVAAFAVLGVIYSVAIPIFETPDELQHYSVVNYISRYGWFPPLGEPGEHLWDQEALQAPLFYWAAAVSSFWVDTSDLSRQAVLQPKANIGDATLPGKKNAFLHGPDQTFPYRGATLAVRLCRWLSVLLGAGTVAATFFIARSVTDAQSGWALFLPSAIIAFIPQFIFINASCSNDSAITLTSTLTLALLLWIARSGSTRRRAALLGAAMGLMALSKLIGTALALLALGLIFLITRRLSDTATAAAVFMAVAGWWYARNQFVYGDPLALNAFLQFVGGSADTPSAPSLSFLWDQFRLLRLSTWGLFGHISVPITPYGIYAFFDIGAAMAVIAFSVSAFGSLADILRRNDLLRGIGEYIACHRARLIALVWVGAVLALGARWFFAAGIQGRLIFPALPAGSALAVWGLRSFSARCSPVAVRRVALAVSLAMLAFTVAVVPLYLLPAYSPPPLVDRIPTAATQTDIRFGDEIALRGYTVARRHNQLLITFYWQTLITPSTDYTVAVRLVRPDGSFWLDYVNYPGMGTTLPTTWRPGELRRDEYVFDTNRFPPVAPPLRLIVGYFDPRAKTMLPIQNWSDVREAGWATLAEVELTDSQ